jgi:hypothetical protein
LLGTLELNVQISVITGSISNGNSDIIVTVFAYLIFGNVIDNLPMLNLKKLFLTIEILMALWFIISGWVSY